MDKSKWEYKKLGEVATFERGLTYSKKDESDSSTKGVLRSNNIDLDSHQLVFDEIKWLNETFEIPQSKKLAKDSIFICMSNGSKTHLGKVAFIDKDYDYAFGGFMGMIKPLNIYPKYLFYYFLSKEYRDGLEQIGKGANINNLRFAQLANFMIPNPITEVQQRIVAELDCLNEMIALKQEQLKEFDKLAQSIFYDMFGEGYNTKFLGEFCEVGTGATPDRKKVAIYYGGNVNWVKTTEVHNCDIYETEERITDIALEQTNCKVYYPGAILMAMYGQGKTRGQVARLMTKAATNQACAAIIPDTRICDKDYLYIYLLLSYEKIRNMARGGNQANLNLSLVKMIPVPLPPLALQQQFAEKIQAIEAQKELVKKSIAETQSLLDYTMDKYFG